MILQGAASHQDKYKEKEGSLKRIISLSFSWIVSRFSRQNFVTLVVRFQPASRRWWWHHLLLPVFSSISQPVLFAAWTRRKRSFLFYHIKHTCIEEHMASIGAAGVFSVTAIGEKRRRRRFLEWAKDRSEREGKTIFVDVLAAERSHDCDLFCWLVYSCPWNCKHKHISFIWTYGRIKKCFHFTQSKITMDDTRARHIYSVDVIQGYAFNQNSKACRPWENTV